MAILVRTVNQDGSIKKSWPSVETVTQKKIDEANELDEKIEAEVKRIEKEAKKKGLLKLKGKKQGVVELYYFVGAELNTFLGKLRLPKEDKQYIWRAINYHAKDLKLEGKSRLDRDDALTNSWRFYCKLAELPRADALEYDWTQWVEMFDTTLSKNDPRIVKWLIKAKRKHYKGGSLQEWFRILRKSVTARISKPVRIDTTVFTKKELNAELQAALKEVKTELYALGRNQKKK